MTDKIKILFRIGSLRTGGAEKILIYLLNNIDYSKYDIDLLLNIKHGKYLNQVPKQVNVSNISTGPEFINPNKLIQNINKIRNTILFYLYNNFTNLLYFNKLKNKKFDIEIGFMQGYAESLYKSPIKKSKKIMWIHTDILFDECCLDLLKFGKKLDKIVSISQKSLDSIVKLNFEFNENSTYIYNPVDVDDVIKKSNANILDKIPKNKENVPVLISVGTIYPVKGFDRLIKIHAKLKSEGIKTQLLILGSALKEDYLNELIKLTENLNVENSVFFLGFQENPYPYIKYADIFVCSSRFEGFSLAVAEAMVLNKPIVSTNVTGPNELLNSKTGILTNNNKEDLYKSLKELILNKQKQDDLKENLKDQNFVFEGKKFLNNFNKLINNILKV